MLQLNSHTTSHTNREQYAMEKAALLYDLNDGMHVYAHFAGQFQCDGYPLLDHNYPSPFPLDKKYRRSFRLSRGENGQIVFNDFAAQQMGDCFNFVMAMYNYGYREALTYIKDTILKGWSLPPTAPTLLERSGRPRLVDKPLLTIDTWMRTNDQSEDLIGLTRYDMVGITSEIRADYHCYYLGGALIGNRYDDQGQPAKDYTVVHHANNPLYGYWYPTTDKWKLNRPLHPDKDFRWGPNNVRGKDQPMFGQHLLDPTRPKQPLGILGPGQRDTMACAALTGCWTGALSSESAHLTAEQFGLLSACFERLAFFSDNDTAGERAAKHLATNWGLTSLNRVVHGLGCNDLCQWLSTPEGMGPRARENTRSYLLDLALGN